MKILKNAKQKNVVVVEYFLTDKEIKDLLLSHQIFFFDDDFNECYSWSEYVRQFRVPVLRAFLCHGDTLDVRYDKNEELYLTILVNYLDTKIVVKLN